MSIKITQKFATCDFCGQILSFNEAKIIKIYEGEEDNILKFCSNKCKNLYITYNSYKKGRKKEE